VNNRPAPRRHHPAEVMLQVRNVIAIGEVDERPEHKPHHHAAVGTLVIEAAGLTTLPFSLVIALAPRGSGEPVLWLATKRLTLMSVHVGARSPIARAHKGDPDLNQHQPRWARSRRTAPHRPTGAVWLTAYRNLLPLTGRARRQVIQLLT
jgi:hypothetical protein